MGVHGLWTLISPVARPINLETMGSKRLAIDSSIWLYQFQNAMRDREGRVLVNAHLLGFLRRISKLLYYGIKPVFVFDGGAPVLKKQTINERKNRKQGGKESLARTAEKLFAAQLRQAAVIEAQKRAKASDTGELITSDTVYFDHPVADDFAAKNTVRKHRSSPPKPTLSATPSPTKKYVPKDQYHLPPLEPLNPMTHDGGDHRLATEQELREFVDQLRPEDLDIDSAHFQALSTEMKYEIIGDLRVKSRQPNRARVEAMRRTDDHTFSQTQILNLKQRNALTQKLLTVTDMVAKANLTIPVKIAAQRNKEYVLVKASEGWILGIDNEPSGSAHSPVKIDVESDSDSDVVFEEVKVAPQHRHQADPSIKDPPDSEDEVELEEVPLPNASRPKSLQHERDLRNAIRYHYGTRDAAPAPSAPILPRKSAHDAGLFLPDEDEEEQVMREIAAEVAAHEQATGPSTTATLTASRCDLGEGPSGLTGHASRRRESPCVPQANPTLQTRHTSHQSQPVDPLAFTQLELDEEFLSHSPSRPSVARDSQPTRTASGQAGDGPEPPSEGVGTWEIEVELELDDMFGDPRVGTANVARQHSAALRLTDAGGSFKEAGVPLTGAVTPSTETASSSVAVKPPTPAAEQESSQTTPVASNTSLKHFSQAVTDQLDSLDVRHAQLKPRNTLEAGLAVRGLTEHVRTESPEQFEHAGQTRRSAAIMDAFVDGPVGADGEIARCMVGAQSSVDEVNQSHRASSPTPEKSVGNFAAAWSSTAEDSLMSSANAEVIAGASFQSCAAPAVEPEPNGTKGSEADDQKEPCARSESPEKAIPWSRSPTPAGRSAQQADQGDSDSELERAVSAEEREQDTNLALESSEWDTFLAGLAEQEKLEEMRHAADVEVTKLKEQRVRDRRDADDVNVQMGRDVQGLLRLFGIPFVVAPMEAEAQCAELHRLQLVDGIITDDSDVFLFGGTRVYKNMFNQNKFVECYLMSDLEQELGLGQDKLVELAFLLGSDYTDGIPGVGPVTAMEILSEFEDPGFKAEGLEGLVRFRDWWRKVQVGKDSELESGTAFRKKFRKKKDRIWLDESWPNRAVSEAYYKPTVDSSTQKFTWGLPDLDGLRQFLSDHLGWSAAKTDEVIVPLIKRQTQRQNGGAHTQGVLDGYFDYSVGSGSAARAPPPGFASGFSSQRLQAIVQKWRQKRVGGGDEAVSGVEETEQAGTEGGQGKRRNGKNQTSGGTAQAKRKTQPKKRAPKSVRTEPKGSAAGDGSGKVGRGRRPQRRLGAESTDEEEEEYVASSSDAEEEEVSGEEAVDKRKARKKRGKKAKLVEE